MRNSVEQGCFCVTVTMGGGGGDNPLENILHCFALFKQNKPLQLLQSCFFFCILSVSICVSLSRSRSRSLPVSLSLCVCLSVCLCLSLLLLLQWGVFLARPVLVSSEESLLHSPCCFQWAALGTLVFNHACMPDVSSCE